MRHFRKPRKEERAVIRFPALMAYWFAYCIYALDRIRLHPNPIDATLAVVMGLFAGGAWLITTPARLKELNLSRAWMVALVAPYSSSILALWYRRDILGSVTLAIAVLVQWILVFLVPRGHGALLSTNPPGDHST